MAHAIRFLSVDAILAAGEGHQGVPLGMAEIATTLYARHLKFDPANPTWPDRDRVVLSNGHGSMLLYSLLHLSGYHHVSLDAVKRFRELGSPCAGHPEYEPAAGIETTTGPLGQGIANALGMAIAEASLNARFGDALVDHRTFAFVGDGCLQEGVGQEVIQLAGHLRLGKLTVFWDDNAITDDGATELSISEDVAERFRVAGWHVQEIDGHDIAAIDAAIDTAKIDPRPSLIACKTVIARGIPRLEGQRGGHSGKLFPEDRAAMAERFGWEGRSFEIPEPIAAAWRATASRGAQDHASWAARLAETSNAVRDEFERVHERALTIGWREAIHAFKARAAQDGKAEFSIAVSGEIAAALYEVLPEMMTACADLEAPTNHKRQLAAFNAGDRAGRYLHCGVREHAMGALANGMVAHGGVIPLAVTYLPFSDYERPAMRMAALMGLPTLFVFSHDSIGIGKNGPTHQPVEIIASLRAMPNMLVLRPCDAVEAAEAWEIALDHRAGPVSLVFARQSLPQLRRDGGPENRSARGAYVLAEAEGGARKVTLLSTGSEVQIALAARELLQRDGIPTAVVSMPCWSLFEAQDRAYRREVLGEGCVRVAVEAAVKFGWERWIGEDGGFVGMAGFGASGPAEELYRHFGITAEAVAEEARLRLRN
ncbi:transketolase [Bosea sp. (in: a-proteobacteria)]|jgi:transketolase|uniref:transketolase n=1 Tax=Bosea sp. (in: a-proteobacteria) TaxID=1871050 RepID=UPI002DDD5963|nr:transketolase [Bosea sp. (in: a-proteobacteria)]HEV2508324.1 transketolase [Bosea sp. (in: a-proteobacteria)]